VIPCLRADRVRLSAVDGAAAPSSPPRPGRALDSPDFGLSARRLATTGKGPGTSVRRPGLAVRRLGSVRRLVLRLGLAVRRTGKPASRPDSTKDGAVAPGGGTSHDAPPSLRQQIYAPSRQVLRARLAIARQGTEADPSQPGARRPPAHRSGLARKPGRPRHVGRQAPSGSSRSHRDRLCGPPVRAVRSSARRRAGHPAGRGRRDVERSRGGRPSLVAAMVAPRLAPSFANTSSARLWQRSTSRRPARSPRC
jgi:hypothetical protein